MKKIFTYGALMFMLLMAFSPAGAGEEKKAQINWVSLQEAEMLMKEKPKKVLIDVYTDWCGWCKVMDRKTYAHPKVIAYINKHFYAIKMDAEHKGNMQFEGKDYSYNSNQRVNEVAAMFLKGKLTYPTTVLLDENFENGQPIPGYQDPANMQLILTYIGENHHKHTPFADYQKKFVATWGDNKTND